MFRISSVYQKTPHFFFHLRGREVAVIIYTETFSISFSFDLLLGLAAAAAAQ